MNLIPVVNVLLEEIIKTREELSKLVDLLCKREQELEDLTLEMSIFELKYQQTVVSQYLILDELNAKLAQVLAKQEPDNLELQFQARLAVDKFLEIKASQEQYLHCQTGSSNKHSFPYNPSPEIRKIYRALIKAIHPDAILNKEEKILRTLMMIEVNKAYEEQNLLRLQTIWFELISQGRISINEESPEKQLSDLRATIAQVKDRIKEVLLEIYNKKNHPLYQLMEKAIAAQQEEDRDLLAEMCAEIDVQIQEAQSRLQEILGEEM